jgi:hypothetical protein
MKTKNNLIIAKFAIDKMIESHLLDISKKPSLLNKPYQYVSELEDLARLGVAIEDNNFTEADSDLLTEILFGNHEGFYNM